MKEQRGITLIALIITVIVLMVLAVVAIRAIKGNAIIEYAKQSANEYNAGKKDEASKLDSYSTYIEEKIEDRDVEGWAIGNYGDGYGVIAKYNQDTKTLTISKNGKSSDGIMKDFTSTTQPWYDIKSDIVEIVIKEGVKNIGDYAFFKCSSTTKVTLPESVTRIGQYAFYETNLSSVILPSNLQYVGGLAFAYCDSLTSINIPGSLVETGHMILGDSPINSIDIDENFDITLEGINQSLFRYCDYIFETYGNEVYSQDKSNNGYGTTYYYNEEITINSKTRAMTYKVEVYW